MSELNSLPPVPLESIQQLRTMVADVRTALQNQEEILRVRGMTLPPGSLQNLDTMESGLGGLHKTLENENIELLQLRTLAETSAMINSSRDLDTVLARAMDEVIALARAERGYIVLADSLTGERQVRIARDPEAGEGDLTFNGSNTILGEVLTSGLPLLADNAYKDPRFQQGSTVMQSGLRSVLCVPLVHKGQITGAVYVDNRLQSGIFTDRERDILAAFANQMAVAIQNAQLFMQGQSNLSEITELNEVRENVFGSIGSGVITTDADDIIRTMNRSASEILSCEREASIGRGLSAVLTPVTAEQIEAVRRENKRLSFEAEMEFVGQRKIMSIKLSPLKDADGATQGVAVVLDDLTEQREREDKLNILRRYLPPAMVDNIEHIAGLALGGERRELTCMYVDVRPLATFPSDLRPKQVMELLNEYHDVATECINFANGVIDKYMGTEIMALFNTQLNPQDDHARSALEAALLMREAFVKLYEWHGIDPQPHFFRIGIHSGVATTGNVGSLSRRDFTALGDTINLAHRLLENAAPGQIMVSDACCDYMRREGNLPADVIFREHEPIRAKGRQQVTNVYEVSRE